MTQIRPALTSDTPLPPLSAPSAAAKRNRLLLGVGAATLLLIVGYSFYLLFFAAKTISTDNAYVGTETAQVNALVAAPVKRILVSETQKVKVGQVLLELDDTDARINLMQAEANYALASRKVEGYLAGDQALRGQIDARAAQIDNAQAQIVAANSDLERAQIELKRRQALSDSGAVSKDELTISLNAFARAKAAQTQALAMKAEALASREPAVGSLKTNQALTSGLSIKNNPEVRAAYARLQSAQLMVTRTRVLAPIDGLIAKKAVQIGQQVQIGTPLMSVVPNQQAYVDANFKEVQLKSVRPGQNVTLTSDLYGKEVVFHGKVVGIAGGTGSAFSLIPAQNATGNWIKVVQRLPVRIALDPRELKDHPLRVGLSMTAHIDIAD
jgi:membrane fusion protein, multidrug efflux system